MLKTAKSDTGFGYIVCEAQVVQWFGKDHAGLEQSTGVNSRPIIVTDCFL